jgi:nitrate reductase NapE component
MKLHAFKFGLACSISAIVLWVICSVLVAVMPAMMMSMSGDMVHMQLQDMEWYLTLAGVLWGLLAWAVVAGFSGWVLATIYNRLLA